MVRLHRFPAFRPRLHDDLRPAARAGGFRVHRPPLRARHGGAADIRYREITFTPFTHTDHQRKGLTIDDLFEGLETGRAAARAEFGVEMRWVFDIPRNLSLSQRQAATTLTRRSARWSTRCAGAITAWWGLGLGGFEPGAPPEPFAHAFDRAHAEGLRCVPHAGETLGPASVWGAVEALHADRIGHGVRADRGPGAADRAARPPDSAGDSTRPATSGCMSMTALRGPPLPASRRHGDQGDGQQRRPAPVQHHVERRVRGAGGGVWLRPRRADRASPAMPSK
jgi:hypothetical protein